MSQQRTTVGDYLDQWLGTIRPNVRATAHAGYERNVAKLKGGLGHVRLADLRAVVIERLYAELAATGGRGGTPLSAKSVVNVHCAWARRWPTPSGWAGSPPTRSDGYGRLGRRAPRCGCRAPWEPRASRRASR